jgi:hypothetical protein
VLSQATIKSHVNHILTKPRLRDRVQAGALACRIGPMDQPPAEASGSEASGNTPPESRSIGRLSLTRSRGGHKRIRRSQTCGSTSTYRAMTSALPDLTVSIVTRINREAIAHHDNAHGKRTCASPGNV